MEIELKLNNVSTFYEIKKFLLFLLLGHFLPFKVKFKNFALIHSRKQKVLPADCREVADTEMETETGSPRPEVKVAPSSEHLTKPKANGYTR